MLTCEAGALPTELIVRARKPTDLVERPSTRHRKLLRGAAGFGILATSLSSHAVRAADLLYHALYRGLLARLPERSRHRGSGSGPARAAARSLPLFRNDDPRLAITLGGVRLPNPLILVVDVLRHRHPAPRHGPRLRRGHGQEHHRASPGPGHPRAEPRAVATRPAGPGLVNCNGFQNPGLEAYRRALAALPHRVPLIVSVPPASPSRSTSRWCAGLERVRRSRRDQHLVAEHQARLRVVAAARRAAAGCFERGRGPPPRSRSS